MDPQTLLTGLVAVAGGALSGGITNAVAIWMLFRPHEPVRIGFWRLQGAIPKNKARLARSVGRTVGEKLLTAEDLALQLSAPAVREAFEQAMERAVGVILAEEHGSLRAELAPGAIATLESAVTELGPRLARRIAEYAGTSEFLAVIAGWSLRLQNDLAGRPVGEVFTPARRQEVARLVQDWVTGITEGDGLERTLRQWVTDQLRELERDDRPLADRLPRGLLSPVQQTISDALPAALDRLGAMLSDPIAKATVKRALREAFDGAAQELLLHERLVARLVVRDTTLERLVDGFEGEGFDRLAAAVTTPEMRQRVAKAVHEGLLTLLREPLGARLARLDGDRRAALEATLGDWLMAAARSEATRQALRETLERALEAAGDLTWDRLLASVPPAQLAGFLREVVAGERGQAWLAGAFNAASTRLLDQPVGRPADWLGPEHTARITRGVTEAAWSWVRAQIPAVVARLHLPEIVEQKILGFSTPLMEDLIKRVTERELKLIVRLGWVLGAVVGLVTFGLSLLW